MKEKKKNNLKSICKYKKGDVEKNMDLIISLVESPKYICKKCARVSNNKKYLCHSLNMKPKT